MLKLMLKMSHLVVKWNYAGRCNLIENRNAICSELRTQYCGLWTEASLLSNITRLNIKSSWKIILVIKFVSHQTTLPNKLSCRLIAIRSGCVLAIFPPLHTFVCQWIVAGRAIRSPIVKVVRQKLCHCSWPTQLLASAHPLNEALAHHGFEFFFTL